MSSYFAVVDGSMPGIYADPSYYGYYEEFNCYSDAFDYMCQYRHQVANFTEEYGDTEFRTRNGTATVYVHGVCSHNGYHDANAGYGIFWGYEHENNVAGPLLGYQTNNLAVLKAVLVAMLQALESGHTRLVLRTNSRYIYKHIKNDVYRWAQNNWRKTNGKPLKNVDMLQEYIHLANKFAKNCLNFVYTPLLACYGSRMASALAQDGKQMKRSY
uniref:ribonuclease H n=1 Tax=Ditylenchus dipsaci TaxID=166011 RepID=A0A915EHL1_9BILA